ncbi:EamA family transporter [Streptomyces wedmorensis]|uniref:EamA family transporter n=1 Tax=Streptomyces wedmorensis TaxID=43759 RepID=A0ABW6IKY7_STRWE
MKGGRPAFDSALTALAPAVWGSTYLVTTELLPADRPLPASTVRALPGGVAALVVAVQPVLVLLFGALLLKERIQRVQLAACVLGVSGVALLVLRPQAGLDGVGVFASPLAATLLGYAFLDQKLSVLQAAGAMAVVVAVVLAQPRPERKARAGTGGPSLMSRQHAPAGREKP